MSLDDQVRDESLKAYYHLCKEKGAANFMYWRVEQAKLQAQYPYLKKALRLRRLINFEKYDKESQLFQLYMDNPVSFEKVKPELMALELEI